MAHKHTKRHKCDKTHFSVRPPDFLHLSPINSALLLYVVTDYVCFGLLTQISLADYSAYLHELVADFDLSLDLFLGDF